jgi:DNA repair protein RadC
MSSQQFGLFVLEAAGDYRPATPAEIISIARLVLDTHIQRHGSFSGPADSKAFVSLRLGHLTHEVFSVVFLDAQHRVIEYREMFRGTLTQTSVYPREVVKEALQLHAAAVILAHNHPSGLPEPSRADELLTSTLKSALALVDVRVLDHLVVGAGQVVSFAERGLL